MTNYSTETEAESYEAADLARIALQAAIDVVDAYQARNGVCDAPFRVTLHVDNGNEADREASGPILGGFDEHAPRGRPVPESMQFYGDGWIRHDGGECPVHPMDVVQVRLGDCYYRKGTADLFLWANADMYRPLRDEDGVPYCSAEGLEDWAEYVATDEDGAVFQYGDKPNHSPVFDDSWSDQRGTVRHRVAPDCFANEFNHWANTLRRVYRREDA